jgi:glycosyltransferase involved in cell wall biosynthesis
MAKIDVKQRGIYNDLMRKFHKEGHNLYIVCPIERREGGKTSVEHKDGVCTLYVRTLNVQKTNTIEKGIGQVSIEYLFKRAIKKYLKNININLILYTTPPIFLAGVVDRMKTLYPKAISYLMLKDMFPQNAIDMGMMKNTGLYGLLYQYFRKQEKRLYRISDYIGCTSPAHITYLLEHNNFISPKKVEICPNSIELFERRSYEEMKTRNKPILVKYGIPTDRPIIIYGGNLGIPQDIPYVIKCLEDNKTRKDCHFIVVGSGTFYPMLNEWYQMNKGYNVTVLKGLPKEEYDLLVQSCHIGLVFLDYRFTFPNYPSRLLSYLEYKMPVICVTDSTCDMGYIAKENGYGCYVPSNNVADFTAAVSNMLSADIKAMGERGYDFLKENYLVEHTYRAIINHLDEYTYAI